MNIDALFSFKNPRKIIFMAFLVSISAIDAKAQAPIIKTFAGTSAGYSGDGGLATSAKLNQPSGIALDSVGNVYIADSYNNVIRKVDPSGIITTFAGNGIAGYSGDGGQATSAQLNAPQSVAVDAHNNLFIGDWNNSVIRKVNISTGIITTFAGTGVAGYSGDGGLATLAQLNFCSSAAFDLSGNVYITDFYNQVIRKVDNAGIITTYAGTGSCGYSGDGGPAIAAQICGPLGMQNDIYGNLYISDIGNTVVRKIDVSTGIISTVAGNGTTGYSGDGGPATSAQLNANFDVSVDPTGNLYIADFNNNVIRKVNTSGIISTYAGNGTGGLSGDGGPATSAQLLNPMGVKADFLGNVYIADWLNNRVRIVPAPFSGNGLTLSQDTSSIGAGPDIGLSPGSTGRFDARGGITYQWNPTIGLSDPTASNPYVTVDSSTVVYVCKIETKPGFFIYDTAVAKVVPLGISSTPSCQNWVSNGDFESYPFGYACGPSGLATDWANAGQFYGNACHGSPSATSCDYFSTLNGPSGCPFGVPNNSTGNQWPHSGNAYAGLILWGDGTCASGGVTYGDWFEYLENKLPCPLVAGQNYSLNFWTAWGWFSEYKCADIGMLVTNGPPPAASSPSGQIHATPQININISGAINGNWTQCSGTYSANGGENYITIGNFTQGTNCSYANGNPNKPYIDFKYVDDVSVTPVPPHLFSLPASQTVCATGAPITYTLHETGSPGNHCTWTDQNGTVIASGTSTVVVTVPTINPGTYTYTCSVNLGCTFSCTVSNTITITVLPIVAGGPSIVTTAAPNPLCVGSLGGTVGMQVVNHTPGTYYVWTPPINSGVPPYYWGGTAHIPAAGTYTFNVMINNGSVCTGQGTQIITAYDSPQITVTPSVTSICPPTVTNATITATSTDPSVTYSWTPSTGLNATTGSVVVANPTGPGTTIYTVTGTNSHSCKSTATSTILYSPNVTINVTNSPMCVGGTSTVTISGGSTDYTIMPTGQTFTTSTGSYTLTLSPTVTTTYTLTGTTNSGCPSHPKVFTINVDPPAPMFIFPHSNTICANSPITLSATGSTGANSYTWTSSSTTPITSHSATITTTPSVTTTYTVYGQGPGPTFCTGYAVTTVSVIPQPTISVTPSVTTICSGTSIQLSTSTNGTSVTWTPTVGLNNPNSMNPTVTLTTTTGYAPTYTYNITSHAGTCSATTHAYVTVSPLPTIITSNPTGFVCAGNQAYINAYGAGAGSTYSISPPPSTVTVNSGGGASFTVAPTIVPTTIYTITGTSGFSPYCSNTATVAVQVHQTPTVTVNSPTVCVNTSATLSATATPTTTTFHWYGGQGYAFGNTYSSGTYTFSGTYTIMVVGSAGGCNMSVTTSVTVQPKTVVISPSSTICIGESATLTATGANTYTWLPSSSLSTNTGSVVIATPTTSTTYTALATSSVTCANTSIFPIVVKPKPEIRITSNASNPNSLNSYYSSINGSSYNWNVYSAMLPSISFNGQGTNTISNIGWYPLCRAQKTLETISLNLDGCISFYYRPNNCHPGLVGLFNISGSTVVTPGSIQTYTIQNGSVPLIPGLTWVVDGGTIQSGQGTGTVTVKWGKGYFGKIAFYALNGTSNGQNGSLDVEICASSAPINNFGPFPNCITLCQMAGSMTLNAGNNGSTYLWSTGATTQTISATYNPLGNSDFYYVTVTKPGATGCKYSFVQCIRTNLGCRMESIESVTNSSGVHFYPNPTNRTITIESASGDILGKITIMNSLGEMVFTYFSNKKTEDFDISQLKSGIYTIYVQGLRGKLIKTED